MPHSVKLYQEIEKLSPDLKNVILLVFSKIERNSDSFAHLSSVQKRWRF
ncbi:MAG: hypothetical protein QW212_06200 [Nitrososphaerales archaeon]